tara:strand:- start:805 stop:1080 length:276 start_codon:yes stop_codon:yes gene_type:complete
MNTFKNIVLSLSFFLLGFAIVYSCNCPIVKDLNKIQEYEYENSECIFVGEVLSVNLDNHTFEIEVIESFDETNSGTIYTGKYVGFSKNRTV